MAPDVHTEIVSTILESNVSQKGQSQNNLPTFHIAKLKQEQIPVARQIKWQHNLNLREKLAVSQK